MPAKRNPQPRGTKSQITVATSNDRETPEHLMYQWTEIKAQKGRIEVELSEFDWEHSKIVVCVTPVSMEKDNAYTPQELDDLIDLLTEARAASWSAGILTPRKLPKAKAL